MLDSCMVSNALLRAEIAEFKAADALEAVWKRYPHVTAEEIARAERRSIRACRRVIAALKQKTLREAA